MSIRRMYKREWLNPEGTAFVQATFNEKGEDRGYGDVKIADCSRIVTLDFNFYDKRQQKAAIKKLNRLIDVLTFARDFVEEEHEGS